MEYFKDFAKFEFEFKGSKKYLQYMYYQKEGFEIIYR